MECDSGGCPAGGARHPASVPPAGRFSGDTDEPMGISVDENIADLGAGRHVHAFAEGAAPPKASAYACSVCLELMVDPVVGELRGSAGLRAGPGRAAHFLA